MCVCVDDSVSLLAEDGLWPGHYEVTFEIRDKQGVACPDKQVLEMEVCTCEKGVTSCSRRQQQLQEGAPIRKSSQLGGAAVGALLFGFLALLCE